MDSSISDSWRERGKQQGRQHFARLFRRSFIVFVMVVLVGLLIRLLFPPFFAARTHLVLIGSGINSAYHVPTIPFVAEDQKGLEAVGSAVVHSRNQVWKSARNAKGLGDALGGTGLRDSDTLLIYMTAHGVSHDGEAYLLCDNFDLRRPDSGRVPVQSLLEQVSRSPAAVKVLFLNAGTVDFDPRLGMVVNEFPRLLENAVRSTNDPNLWVFCSHETLQYSHVSRAVHRSLFGLFVAEGLRGAADLDRDWQVELHELAAFTSANVSRWVRESSDQAAKQTPRLMWGGVGRQPLGSPLLVTLARSSEPHTFDIAEFIKQADAPEQLVGPVAGNPQSTGVLTRRHLALKSRATGPSASSTSTGGEQNAEDGSEQKKPVAGSEDASQATDAEGPAAETASAGTEQPEAEAAADPMQRPRQLLADAWRLRDKSAEVWSAKNPRLSPIENVPHLWREFQAELLGFEQRLRAGAGIDSKSIQSILEDNLSMQPSPTEGDRNTVTSLWDPTRERPLLSAEVTIEEIHSLALAQMIAELQQTGPAFDAAGLVSALEQETRQNLDEWLTKNWREGLNAYYELRFLKHLTEQAEMDWELLRTAAKTCLLGERVAALDLLSPGWIRKNIDLADQYQRFAEQLVFDRIGTDWQERAFRIFERAAEEYAAAEAKFNTIREAEHLRDSFLIKAPYYIRQYRGLGSAAGGTRDDDALSALFSQLMRLTELLDRANPGNVADISRLMEDLEDGRARIEFPYSDAAVERLIERTPTPGEAWRVESLLQTPLVSAVARESLLSVAEDLARQSESEYQSVVIELADFELASPVDPIAQPSVQDWKFLLEQARHQTAFVQLCRINVNSTTANGTERTLAECCEAVCNAFESLQEKHRAVMEAYGDDPKMPLNALESVDSLWSAYERLGTSLQAFYTSLDVPTDGRILCEPLSATASRSLRMLDPRDAWRFREVDIASIGTASRLHTTLQWQAARLEEAAVYRTGTDSQLLVNSADAYRLASARICGQVVESRSAPRLTFIAPSIVDLEDSVREFDVEIQNLGADDAMVCLSLNFDAELLEVTSQVDVDNEQTSANGAAAAWSIETNSVSQDRLLQNAIIKPIRVAANQRRHVRLQLSRRGSASQSTKLIIDAYDCLNSPLAQPLDSAMVAAGEDDTINTLIARQRVEVVMPVAELLVLRNSEATVSADRIVKLYPYPNRLNRFKLGVVNQASMTKQVLMSLFALDRPMPEISPEDYGEFLKDKSPLREFNMTVPGNGIPAFPAVVEEGDAEKEAKAEGEQQPADAPAPQTLAKLVHGLLVALKDSETGQISLRQVEFAVQRPRRYLRPKVGFNAAANRIEIEVSARNPSLLPPGEDVRIVCRLADTLPGELQGKLQGTLNPPSYKAAMFINVPSPPPQMVRLYVDVDDYPRAFIFDVPCGRHAGVPELDDERDVRIGTTSEQRSLAATSTLPLKVQVDAPIGSFENGEDFVELGIDLEGAGVPDPSSIVRLRTDRSVSLDVVSVMPDGTMELRAEVSDFELELPTERLENVEINLAGRFRVMDDTVQLPRIPFLIDTAPPIVGPVEPKNYTGVVPVQGQLELTAWAWDEGSGVKKVEATFDVTDSGVFPADGDVSQGIQSANREWLITIGVGETVGSRTLLVRGIDQVGNASDPIKVPVNIVSLAENSARIAQQTVELAGSIKFRDDVVPQAELKLTAIPVGDAGPPSTASAVIVKSDQDGRFSIQDVAPGNYILNAKGVIRNRVRLSEQEISVEPGPRRTIHVDVDLP